MPGHNHGPSIKRPSMYEGLKRHGFSKTSAARISNASLHKGKAGKSKGKIKR